jgi:hypothetical protein
MSSADQSGATEAPLNDKEVSLGEGMTIVTSPGTGESSSKVKPVSPSALPGLTTDVDQKIAKRAKNPSNWSALKTGVAQDSRLKFETTLLQDENDCQALKKLGYFHCDNGDLKFGVLLLTKVGQSKLKSKLW